MTLALVALAGCYSGQGGRVASTPPVTLIDNIAADDTAANRTFNLDTDGWASLAVYVDFTRSAGTAVTLTCSATDDEGTTDFPIQECTFSSGTCTLDDIVYSKTTSVSDTFHFLVDTLGAEEIECVFAVASGGSSDFITIDAQLIGS